MVDYIAREAVRQALRDPVSRGIHFTEYELDKIHMADVEPVRHGRNLKIEWPSLFECSECHWSDCDTYTGDTNTYNYCPACGAKMDGDSNG